MVQPGNVRLQQDASTSAEAPDSGEPLPPDALDINVAGRLPTEPDDGFGQLWRKRYWVRLVGDRSPPSKVIEAWRDHYGDFWPGDNRFYRPLTGLRPGEVGLADLEMPGGARLSTGIIVSDVNDTSFRFVTPQGHTFAGAITFSARDDAGTTVAEVEIVMRASDPIFELAMPLIGHRREDRFWQDTLASLADYFGVQATPEMSAEVLDRHRRWRNAGNVIHNAFIHTAIYMASRPFRALAGKLQARGKS